MKTECTLNKQRIDGLKAQLAMALSRHPVSKMQVSLLRAQIDEMYQICSKCGGAMQPRTAIVQSYTGIPDFAGDAHPVTVSPAGPGRLVDCLKCADCGWSTSAGGS